MNSPVLCVHVGQVLVAEVDGVDERAGLAVELPQDGQLAHAEDRLLAVVVDQDALERLVHVVAVARDVLEEPPHLARGRVEGQRRVAVERVPVGAARVPRPRLRLRRAVVHEAVDGVVTARDPGVAAGPEQERQVAPGVAAALARPRDGRGPPYQAPGPSVDADDVAGVVAEALAAAETCHDRPVGDHRTAREAVAVVVGRDVGVPAHLAGARVEADDVRIDGVQDDEVLVDRQAAQLRGRPQPLVHVPAVLPEEVARRAVESMHHVAGVGDVHHAVVDDRRRLRHARLEPPRPRQPQLADVVAVDLVERAVAPAVQRAPPAQPVGRVGVLEDRVGDGRERLVLRPRRTGGEKEERDDGAGNDGADETRHHADLLRRGRIIASRRRDRTPACVYPSPARRLATVASRTESLPLRPSGASRRPPRAATGLARAVALRRCRLPGCRRRPSRATGWPS